MTSATPQSVAATAFDDAIGTSTPRKEDARLLRGQGCFVDDIEFRGMLHAAFVRSPVAHARISAIETAEAEALPGVVAVVTGEDLARLTTPGTITQVNAPSLRMETIPVAKVRFAGDLVACVIATDRYIAEDAAELVDVEFEPLTPHLDMFSAQAATKDPVDPDLPHNLHTHETKVYGDVAGAFAQADRVVEAQFRSPRLTHVPIEPRGVVAHWDEGRRALTLYTGQQTAHVARTRLAARLGLRENQVRIVSPDVGGAFGQKIPLYREDITVAAMAIHLRRPIKWIEDRMENLTASNHARDDAVYIQAAVRADGIILGIKAALWADFGAYAYFPPSYIIDVVGWLLPGGYRVANYEYTINVALTNKCPAGTMRAPMAIVTWATEGLVEKIAAELGLDPVEVRRSNLIGLEDQPYVSAPGYTYEALTLREGLEDALSRFDVKAFRETQAQARQDGRLLGLGIATVLEPTTYGSEWYKKALGVGSGHEAARVRIDPSGTVSVSVGINPSGQGYETTLSQVVAAGLGTDIENVAVLLGDTDVAPYGMGSRGSRGAVAGNGVAYLAAVDLHDKVLRIAAHLSGEPLSALRLAGGQVTSAVDGDPLFSLAEIAWIAHMDPSRLPAGEAPGLEVHKTYDPPPMTFSNGTHICVVEVVPQTGRTTIAQYMVVEDAGTLINPMIVDGQIRGGIAMGVGHALFEEVLYDEDGNNTTATFMDYLIPTMDVVPEPEIHHLHTPNPHTPRGMKGMSEGPVQGSVAAIALAVQDAIRHTGAEVNELPLSPRRVRQLLRSTEGQNDAD